MKLLALCIFTFLFFSLSTVLSAQEINPGAAKFYNLGIEQVKNGDFQNAVASFDSALAYEKDYRFYFQKGIALKKLQMFNESLPAFQEVIKLKPDYEASYYALAGSFQSLGQTDNAIINYKKVIELKPDYESAYFALAVSYQNSGKTEDVIGVYLKLLQNTKNDTTKNTVKETLALTYYNLGNDKQAAADLQGAIDSYDNSLKYAQDYKTFYQKAIALKKLKKAEESVPVLLEVIKLKPDYDGGYNALAGSFFVLGKMDDAIANYEKVLLISTNEDLKTKVKEPLARAYHKLGSDLAQKKQYKKAIVPFLKALEYFNLDVTYLTLANCYNETKEYDNAITAAENALKYKSTISVGGPDYYLGIAYKNKKNLPKAKEYFLLAKEDPKYKKAAEYELGLIK